MLQLVYVSSLRPGTSHAAPAAILEASRRNNARTGITGLLYSDGTRFLQVLEGPEAEVDKTFRRIEADPRHRAIVVLSRTEIEAREFGDWAMAHRGPGADGDAFVARIAELTRHASPDVRATFEGFAKIRSAA